MCVPHDANGANCIRNNARRRERDIVCHQCSSFSSSRGERTATRIVATQQGKREERYWIGAFSLYTDALYSHLDRDRGTFALCRFSAASAEQRPSKRRRIGAKNPSLPGSSVGYSKPLLHMTNGLSADKREKAGGKAVKTRVSASSTNIHICISSCV